MSSYVKVWRSGAMLCNGNGLDKQSSAAVTYGKAERGKGKAL